MDLMDACGNTDELEIFETRTLRDLLDFKWDTYASTIHYIMFSFHCIYMVIFSIFINEMYVYRTGSLQTLVLAGSAVCLVFPMLYDMTQLKKQGIREYSSDIWNYFDQMHIWGGFINIYLHSNQCEWTNFGDDENPRNLCLYVRDEDAETTFAHIKKTLSIVLTFLILLKTFFFLRLFRSMAHLVSMMKQVFNDL